jgi:hypothetical protein
MLCRRRKGGRGLEVLKPFTRAEFERGTSLGVRWEEEDTSRFWHPGPASLLMKVMAAA